MNKKYKNYKNIAQFLIENNLALFFAKTKLGLKDFYIFAKSPDFADFKKQLGENPKIENIREFRKLQKLHNYFWKSIKIIKDGYKSEGALNWLYIVNGKKTIFIKIDEN